MGENGVYAATAAVKLGPEKQALPYNLKILISFNSTNGANPFGSLIADANGNLFGMTFNGGANGYGTVFEITNTATGYVSTPMTLASFDYSTDGANPYGSLIADANGDLFGMTNGGGASGYGTVFEIINTPTGYASTPTTLISFTSTNGANPYDSLIIDANGDLFGTTNSGGANGDGTVFEITNTPTGYASTPTTLVSFAGTDGVSPYGSLITDAHGDLFGTTNGGGANGFGTVFEITNTPTGYASTPTTLVSFNGTNGEYPYGSLIADAHDDLFGTTSSGGANGFGTVFEIINTTTGYASTPTTLASFDSTNGADPQGSLIIDANGDLFGTANSGGANGDGTVFEITNTPTGYASTPTTLVSFNTTNGANPFGSLVVDANGDLFGTTNSGGANGDGTVFELVVPCFLPGTGIATPDGEVPVERLTPGDLVCTASGTTRPVLWVGTGRTMVRRGRRSAATPVIVRKGALADNVPNRDLRVTKGHALCFDGVLIPVEFLVNHRSILWDDLAQEVTIYHIEFDSHDVLLANGAPAESYRDDGNRWLFHNPNPGWTLPPQPPCAPVLTGGPIVDDIWRHLLERAGPRREQPLTDDPDLHLLIDGKRVDPMERNVDRCAFRLTRRPAKLRLCSRSAVPQELGIARDARQLGVAVERVLLLQAERQQVLRADAATLTDGWHAFEPNGGIRWTDGDAALPARLCAGMASPAMLVVQFGAATRYVDDGEAIRAA